MNFSISNLKVGIMKHSDDNNLITRTSFLEGIDEFLYFEDAESENIKAFRVTHGTAYSTGNSENALWKQAEINTCRDTIINDFCGMYFLSNRKRFLGAGNIVDRDALMKFMRKHVNKKLYILPSSVHELILIPDTDNVGPDVLSGFVKEVNANPLAIVPEDVLADTVYIASLEEGILRFQRWNQK